MQQLPTTRATLLLRLQDSAEQPAWDEFCAVYEPAVFRYACRKGLSDADAQDVVQEVLTAVFRSIDLWKADDKRGSFRRWLSRVTRNAAVNALRRNARREEARGGSAPADLLATIPDSCTHEDETIGWEVRREMFRLAAERVCTQVAQRTWGAFQLTTLDGKTAAEASQELGMPIGSVYTAKCRVLARLRNEIEAFLEDRP